ncbi:MmpS family transport accessory protein [Mycobacterium simiae]|uniref:MmpS protein n=1 Tax=Mycobacterium simiae TaxID=1784 RepID=A0A1X0XT02_MYCSI|nr:MmpS family transport accessory protein [Mycobacterium simiae]ORJ55980.1 MmpS protein [Mycobacterium simiae]PLV49942.1 mmpS family membrane protein [Mycobacterium tuberculosis variant microti OV254]BBX39474.1 putative membrane protein, MmpS family [Mycobacterium simiae]
MVASLRRRLVTKLWLPTLVVVVAVLAGCVIDSAHRVFGSQDRTRSPGSKFSIAQFNPKRIEYDVFGELGGWGRVSYWDVNSHAIAVDLATLPWRHTEVTVLTTATADITAQVAGGNVGCRIIVDGQVRSEHTATGEHAGVWCQVLSA